MGGQLHPMAHTHGDTATCKNKAIQDPTARLVPNGPALPTKNTSAEAPFKYHSKET